MRDRDQLITEFLRVVRFGLVGVANTAIYTCTYIALLAIGIQYILASVLAYVVAISIAYFLNHRITFRVADHSSGLVVRFFAVQGAGALVNIIALAILVERLHWNEIVAQLVIIPPVIIATFMLNRLVVFGAHVDSRLAEQPTVPR